MAHRLWDLTLWGHPGDTKTWQRWEESGRAFKVKCLEAAEEGEPRETCKGGVNSSCLLQRLGMSRGCAAPLNSLLGALLYPNTHPVRGT